MIYTGLFFGGLLLIAGLAIYYVPKMHDELEKFSDDDLP
jgi:hypothetical protein